MKPIPDEFPPAACNKRTMKRVLRSVAAVIAGYFAMAVPLMLMFFAVALVLFGGLPDRRMPPPPVGVNLALLVFSGLFAVLGGYVAAWVAGRAPRAHALALGLLMLALGAVMLLNPESPEPMWSRLATVAMALPCPLVGGWLRARRAQSVQS